MKAQRLGRVARTISGTGFPPALQGEETGDYPFLKVSDLARVQNRNGVEHAENWVSSKTVRDIGARVVPAGWTAFPKVGAALLGNARGQLVRSAVMDNNMMAVGSDKLHARFLYWWLGSVDMGELSQGGTLPFVSDTAARDLNIWMLPEEEQRRIADFLDERVALIDRIIAARGQQVALLLERLSASVDNVAQAEPNEKLSRLGRVARIQSGLTVDAARHFDGEARSYPYLRVANVQSGRLDLAEVKEVTVSADLARRTTLHSGDVLMTEGGDLDKLGRGAVWRDEIPGCLHQNHIFAVRCNPSLLMPDFLAVYSLCSDARAYFESTGVRSTNLASTSSSKVMSLPLPVRSLEAQQQAVTQYRGAADEIDSAVAAIEVSSNLLREYKQSLITAAVTGQFDVTTASTRIPE